MVQRRRCWKRGRKSSSKNSGRNLCIAVSLLLLVLHLAHTAGSMEMQQQVGLGTRAGRQHGAPQCMPPETAEGSCSWRGRGRHILSPAVAADNARGIGLLSNIPQLSSLFPSFVAGGERTNVARDIKMAFAGALAGAIATAALFPIDTAKTLRQANPHAFRGTREALAHICRTRGPLSIYTGLPTAVVGAMPSSALYFGTYEAVKTRLLRIASRNFPGGDDGDGNPEQRGKGGEGCHPAARTAAHAVAAACGNAASSLVFVPKEFVKQTLQASGMGAPGAAQETAKEIVRRALREQGVRGLYRGYWATLSRNIPSAVIRFSLYEEIKLLLGPATLASAPPVFLLAGALAGACASGITTPFDVLKTRVATGTLDGSRGFSANLACIVAEDGWKGLYAGFQPRVVMSALFTAVGFGSFECLKCLLGVPPLPSGQTNPSVATPRRSKKDLPNRDQRKKQ